LKQQLVIVAVVLFFSIPDSVFSQSISFPMNHWVYEYLDRLQTKGIITDLLPGTKPYTRKQIANSLFPILKNYPLQEQLNSTEKEQLEFLVFEFREEFSKLGIETKDLKKNRLFTLRRKSFLGKMLPDFLYQNNRNLLSVELPNFNLFGDFVLKYERNNQHFSYQGNETIQEERHGIKLWGSFGKYMQFYFDFRDAKQWGGHYPHSNNWSFERAGYTQAHGNYVYFDETTTALVTGSSFWQVMIGKEKNYWGPGQYGALAISNWSTSYDQLKIQLHWRNIRFTAITAFLQTYPPIYNNESSSEFSPRKIKTRKYLAAHRLEFRPVHWLILGLHETLIYGERGLELAYLNPINFYWSAEHHLGDQDNSAIGFDMTVYPGKRLKFYSEVFFDDLQTGKITSDWYGNKWAFTIGGMVVDFINVPNFDVLFEWSRIRPYAYSHKYPINVYKNYSTVLGHRLGPNSEIILAGATYRFSRWMSVNFFYENEKHGSNGVDRNVGGDIDLSHRINDGETQPFLGGILEKRTSFRLLGSYELFRNAIIQLSLAKHHFKNVISEGNSRVNGNKFEWDMNFQLNF